MIFTGIAAAIGAVATFIGGLGAIGTFALQVAAGIGVSYLAKALAGKPPEPASGSPGIMGVQGTLQASGDLPRSFIFGQGATAGSLTYANTWGADGDTPNAYFTQVIALSDLPVKGLIGLWVNGEKCTSGPTAHPSFGFPITQYNKDGKDHLWVKFYDGTQTAADSFLVTQVSSSDRPYPPTRVGAGVSYAICTALVEDTLFTGFPSFLFEIDGVRLYDPSRDSTNGGAGTQRYSDPATWGGDGDYLPAVQVYNLLRGLRYNSQWFYGLQSFTARRANPANWNAQIAKCRAEIEVEDGSEPTYRSGGQVTVDVQLGNTVEALLTTCQGKLSEVGGFYKIHVGAPDSPTFFFTDADILSTEEQSFTPFFGLADTVTGITAKYPSRAEAWALKPAPPIYRTDLEAKAGNRRLLSDVSLDFVPYDAQAQRLMRSALLAAQRARRHTLSFGPEFWVVEPGDVGAWKSARNGYGDLDNPEDVGKLFEVNGAVDKANLDVTMDLTEVDPADYTWDHSTDFVPLVQGPTIFPRPAPQPIVDWDAQPDIIEDNDGRNRRPGIRLIWDGDMPGVSGVQYEVRLAGTEPVIARGRTDQLSAGELRISQSLLPETAYEVRGQYLPSSPRDMLWSDWIAVTTPNVKLSSIDFEEGLKDLVTNYFGQTTEQINSVLQTIAAVVAQQAGTNQNDKKQVIERLVATAGRLGASIDDVRTVAVDANTALAEFKIAATAMIDEHSASIEQTQTAIATIDGKLAAAWALTTNVDGYISSIQALNDGTTSAFVLMADIFKIVFPGLTPKDVFQIANVNGVPQAVLRADMLFDGMVTARSISVDSLTAISAHFGDAQVDGKLTMGPGGRLVIDGYVGAIMGFRP